MLTYLAGRNTIKKEKTTHLPWKHLLQVAQDRALKCSQQSRAKTQNMSVLLEKTAKSTPARGMQLKRSSQLNAKNIKSSSLVLIKCKSYFIPI